MYETKYFVFPYVLHNKLIVKYVNFGGNFGFNHKNSIDIDIFKVLLCFLIAPLREMMKKMHFY